jgi:DNA-binding PadR family transcriptional regulator
LEAEGMVKVTIETVNNRPRKYYSLTSNGKKEVRTKIQELSDFIRQMQALLQLKPEIPLS